MAGRKKDDSMVDDDEKLREFKVEPVQMPTPQDLVQADVMNNCAIRTVISGVMGGVMGAALGLFMSGFEFAAPNPEEARAQEAALSKRIPFRQKVVDAAKYTGGRTWSSFKTFAVMGALYSGSECVVEKVRAKHDVVNTLAAGCFTGGALAARAGPQAACLGCMGFAAFSAVIDKILDHD
eukprot:jgi/Mesvir1/9446/Mv09843-RA.1